MDPLIFQSRSHSVIAAVILVICSFIYLKFHILIYEGTSNYEDPKLLAGDFSAFYLGGKLSKRESTLPYNSLRFQEEQTAFLKELGFDLSPKQVYALPPFITPLFEWLSNFQYINAALIWLAICIVCSVISLYLVTRHTNLKGRWLALSVLTLTGFAPFSFECLRMGQVSGILLLIFTLMFISLKMKAFQRLGVFLSLGSIKPPIFIVVGIVFLLSRMWKTIGACLIGGSVLLAISIYLVGVQGFKDFLFIATAYRPGGVLPDGRVFIYNHNFGLLGLFTSIFWDKNPLLLWTCYLASSAIILYSILPLLKSEIKSKGEVSPLSIAAVFAVASLISVYIPLYDQSVLLLPLWILFSEAGKQNQKGGDVSLLALFLIVIATIPLPHRNLPEFNFRSLAFLVWTVGLVIVAYKRSSSKNLFTRPKFH